MFGSVLNGSINIGSFLICIATALILGICTSLVFSIRTKFTNSLKISIAVLPAIVTVIIMLVNGNIGAGLGVAGTFSLCRFRSSPGSAKELTGVFVAVAIGLICGMGYIGTAILFFVIIALAILLLTAVHFGEVGASVRKLKIVIPENLDYDSIFDDLFEKYTSYHELETVRTTNMGTLFELTYEVVMKDRDKSKEFLDELRCRNGNLNIIFGRELSSGLM